MTEQITSGTTMGASRDTDIQFNIGDAFEAVAKAVPDRLALIFDEQKLTYAELDAEANRLSNFLADTGVETGDHVALYLMNSMEHLIAIVSLVKMGAPAVNVNYRYTAPELHHIMHDSDAKVILVELPEHQDLLASMLDQLPEARTLVILGEITEKLQAAAQEAGIAVRNFAEYHDFSAERDYGVRTGDEHFIMYTGGTTGYPKGVMWDRQFWEYGHLLNTAGFAALLPKMKDAPREFFAPASGERTTIVHRFLQSGLNRWLLGQQWVQDFLLKRITATALRESAGSLDELATAARKSIAAGKQARSMIACPLMHGTGYLSAIMTLTKGGALLFAESKNFSPKEIWEIIERERATSLSIVGDTFAAPLAAELEAKRYDTSALRSIVSSGVIFSAIHKRGLLKFNPQLVIMDSLGASEGLSRAEPTLASDSGEAVRSMNFQLAPHMKVFDEQDNEVVPGSDTIGQLAVSGAIPRGYWGDPEKTAKTFRVIRGVRYSIFGDFCKLREDGTLILLGRGTHCINTGGEKVYPEEVEKVLKDLPEVEDCCVLGVPDERWGQAINAMVSFKPGQQLSEQRLIEHCEQKLSNYKKPKKVWIVGEIPRRENGKMDYPQVKLLLSELTGVKLTA